MNFLKLNLSSTNLDDSVCGIILQKFIEWNDTAPDNLLHSISGLPGHGHPHQAVPGHHGEELLLAPARGPGGPRWQHQVPGGT